MHVPPQTLPFHPVTALLPPQTAKDIAWLRQKVLELQSLDPIVTSDGFLVDGGVRLGLCEELGITPKFEDVGPLSPGEAVTLFVSLNLYRLERLTAQQRAAWAARSLEFFQADSKAAQRAGAQRGGKRSAQVRRGDIDPDVVQAASRRVVGQAIREESLAITSRDRAAEVYRVSSGYVAKAKEILEVSPNALGAVADGSVTLSAATEESRRLRDFWRKQIQESPYSRYLALAPNGITIVALTLSFASPGDATRLLNEITEQQSVVAVQLAVPTKDPSKTEGEEKEK